MKILLINKYHYIKGGSDRIYLSMSKLLEKHRHEVIHFSTFSPKNEPSPTSEYFVSNPEFLDQNFFRKVKYIFRYIYSLEAKRKLKRLIKKERPDLAHLHIFFGELSLSILPVLKQANMPVVMTLHEFKMLCPIYSFLDQKGQICEKCANSNYLHSIVKNCNKGNIFFSIISALESYIRDWCYPYEKYVDQFLPVSDFLMQKHIHYKRNLHVKTSVLHNFVPLQIRRKVQEEKYFIYFGRISREKGLRLLIEVFAQNPDLKLKIVGDGPERQALEEYVILNEAKNVSFMGYRSGDELEELILNAHFSVTPSECYESFGMGALESLSFGTPVIASDLGGLKEVLIHGKNGYLFPSGDIIALNNYINKASNLSEEYYLQMSNQCAVQARKFSEKVYYDKLISVYLSQLK